MDWSWEWRCRDPRWPNMYLYVAVRGQKTSVHTNSMKMGLRMGPSGVTELLIEKEGICQHECFSSWKGSTKIVPVWNCWRWENGNAFLCWDRNFNQEASHHWTWVINPIKIGDGIKNIVFCSQQPWFSLAQPLKSFMTLFKLCTFSRLSVLVYTMEISRGSW